MKNGYSQKAIFMDWFGSGYKLVESEHYSKNGLRADEKKMLADMIKGIENVDE